MKKNRKPVVLLLLFAVLFCNGSSAVNADEESMIVQEIEESIVQYGEEELNTEDTDISDIQETDHSADINETAVVESVSENSKDVSLPELSEDVLYEGNVQFAEEIPEEAKYENSGDKPEPGETEYAEGSGESEYAEKPGETEDEIEPEETEYEEELLESTYSVNTDDDVADRDGAYTFVNSGDRYGYESYFKYEISSTGAYKGFVGARLYDVTIPSPGTLTVEADSAEITHMLIEVIGDDYEKEWHISGMGISAVRTTDILGPGEYTVIFTYDRQPDSTLVYDSPGVKYFTHYITWTKASKVPVTGVKLNKTSQTLAVGKTAALKATVSPSYATNKKVTWSSSNTSVATVNANGTVTAKKAGTATITVTTADQKKKAACKITVTQPVTGVSLNKTKLTMGNGQSVTLKAAVAPSDATNRKVTWKSSNTKIASVNSAGKVTAAANANGTVKITATTADGKKVAACTVTVKKPSVSYRTHVQTYGWQGYVKDGAMSGTSGQAKRLEGINIKLSNLPYSGSIVYRTHVQTYGWQGWKKDGAMSGTSGQAKRLEGIQIYLTGELAKHYDVYYRVHAQTFGWLGYAKNGLMAGTSGLAKRLEGINIWLVPKGGKAPGSTARPYVVGGGGKLPDNPYRG